MFLVWQHGRCRIRFAAICCRRCRIEITAYLSICCVSLRLRIAAFEAFRNLDDENTCAIALTGLLDRAYDVPMKTLLDHRNPAARWELIKGALRARGSSLSAVARSLGLSREAVHHVRNRPYPAVEAAIAKVVGDSPAALWPDRYDKAGAPKRKRPNAPMANPRIRREAKVNVNSMTSGAARRSGLA